MREINFFSIFFFLTFFSILSGETDANLSGPAGLLKVYVSIPPQSYFVERLGADYVTVNVLVGKGADPHTFEPTPKQIMALGQADVYFSIGIHFETLILKKIRGSNPRLEVISTDAGMERLVPQRLKGYEDHKNFSQVEPDPHIWLSPPLINLQAENIYRGLIKADPENAEIYKNNYDEFLRDVEEVHARITKLLKPHKGKSFLIFHPALGYFAETYGLVQVAIEMEGKGPYPKQIERLIKEAGELYVNIIFVEPQFDKKSAKAIAEAIGGTVVTIDPLRKNVLENLEEIAEAIEKSFK